MNNNLNKAINALCLFLFLADKAKILIFKLDLLITKSLFFSII